YYATAHTLYLTHATIFPASTARLSLFLFSRYGLQLPLHSSLHDALPIYPGNIGYLKNIIKVSCAAAYRDQENSDVIKLHLNNIMVEELPTFAEYGNFLIDPNTVLERSGNSLIKKSLLSYKNIAK